MTLQEQKEKAAQEFNNSNIQMINAMPLMAIKKAFISGFDEADPIVFHDWASINAHATSIVGEYIYVDTTGSYRYTTEELYLKFLEYKQTLKH